MRNLSIWAHHHSWTARILIIVSSIILTAIAILFGYLIYDEGYLISSFWTWLLVLLILLQCAVYPNQKNKSYWLRKAFDLSLATCSFLLFVFTSNQYSAPIQPVRSANLLAGSSYAASSLTKPVKPTFRQQKRMAKQWLKAFRETYKKASPTSKALLIFLTVLVAAGLIVLVSALACGIACTSSEALGLIVLLLGSAGVVLLARMVIQRIRLGPKPKPKTEPVPAT